MNGAPPEDRIDFGDLATAPNSAESYINNNNLNSTARNSNETKCLSASPRPTNNTTLKSTIIPAMLPPPGTLGERNHSFPLANSSLLLTNQAADAWIRSLPFPQKLYCLIEDGRYRDCMVWTSSGDSFIIRSERLFGERIINNYFRHTKFNSFVRQLNNFGFRRTRLNGRAINIAIRGLLADAAEYEGSKNESEITVNSLETAAPKTVSGARLAAVDNNNNNNNNNNNSQEFKPTQGDDSNNDVESVDSDESDIASAIQKGDLALGYLLFHPLFRRDRPDLLTGITRRSSAATNLPPHAVGNFVNNINATNRVSLSSSSALPAAAASTAKCTAEINQRKRKMEEDSAATEFESTVSLLKSTVASFAAIENEWETRSDTSLVDDVDPKERVEQLTKSFSDVLSNMRGINLIISTQLQNQIKHLRDTIDRRNQSIEDMIRYVQNMPGPSASQFYFNDS